MKHLGTLKVYIPKICQAEQKYVLDVILREYLGLEFVVETYSSDHITLELDGNPKKLTIAANFFHLADTEWMSSESLPSLPLEIWSPENSGLNVNLVEKTLPILYGRGGLLETTHGFHLDLDIFGSCFFMLSRYEETLISVRDKYERIQASSSIAYKAGFLERPIVNEYVEILWATMLKIWPQKLVRKKRQFRMLVSCDVDHPLDLSCYSLIGTVRRILARLIRDNNPKLAVNDTLNYIFKKFGSHRFDSYLNNIKWIMSVNTKLKNIVVFNFIPIQTDINKDDPTDISSPMMTKLIDNIAISGHQIGIHPGFKTYNSSLDFERSAIAFFKMLSNLNINQKEIGGRQHYLRYDVTKTPILWDLHGFEYDSSLCFAEKSGFRSGTCYEYSMYDLLARKKLNLKQRPLINMESSIISDNYEGVGFSAKAVNRFKKFKSICKQFDGDYSLLWHNSYLSDKRSKKMYLEIISD